MYNINKNIFKLSKHSFKKTVIDLVQPIIILCTLVVLLVFGPNGFFYDAFYPLLYSIGFLWSRNINIMQVAFITKANNNVFNIPTMIFMFGYLGFAANSFFCENLMVSSYKFALGMLLAQMLFYVEFAISVILQMKHILKINLFNLDYLKASS